MKIICIVNNYSDNNKTPEKNTTGKPIFYLKPDTALLRNNNPFFIPDFSNEIQCEAGLIVKINRLGKSIQTRFANRYFEEIGLGINFIARDIQKLCIENGQPWEAATTFDYSLAVGNYLQKSGFNNLNNLCFSLVINGITVQKACAKNMIFKIEEIIHKISQNITFRTGDLIFTGTSSGAGLIKPGDRLQAYIEENLLLDFFVK